MKTSAFLLFLIFFSSCAFSPPSVELSNQGNAVKTVPYLNPNSKAKLVEIDQVTCDQSGGFRTRSTNLESCMNELRNKAVAMGGYVLLVNPDQNAGGGQYCANCVNLTRTVYKVKK